MRILEPGIYNSAYTLDGEVYDGVIAFTHDSQFPDEMLNGVGECDLDGLKMRLVLPLGETVMKAGTWAEFTRQGVFRYGGEVKFVPGNDDRWYGMWKSTDDNGQTTAAGTWVLSRR